MPPDKTSFFSSFFNAHATCTKIWTAATASVEKQKLILDQEENYTFSRMSRSTSTFACKTKMLCKYYLLNKSTNLDAKCKATTGRENKTERYITVQSQQNTSLPTTLSALRTAASCGVPCFSTFSALDVTNFVSLQIRAVLSRTATRVETR